MAGRHEGERELSSQRNDPSREQGSHLKESGISKLLETRDLFDTYTPEGKDPTCYPIEIIENLVYDTSVKAQRGEIQQALAENWPSWKKSIKKIQMAYEITAYPLLELAEARFASDPKRDPTEHRPSSYEMAINELIRDAQEHPGKNTRVRKTVIRTPPLAITSNRIITQILTFPTRQRHNQNGASVISATSCFGQDLRMPIGDARLTGDPMSSRVFISCCL